MNPATLSGTTAPFSMSEIASDPTSATCCTHVPRLVQLHFTIAIFFFFFFLNTSVHLVIEFGRRFFFLVQVPFQVPLEVNIVLIGFNGDGGYRYVMDPHKLEEFLRVSFSTYRPSCQETGEPLDIEHHIVYNVYPVSNYLHFNDAFFLVIIATRVNLGQICSIISF